MYPSDMLLYTAKAPLAEKAEKLNRKKRKNVLLTRTRHFGSLKVTMSPMSLAVFAWWTLSTFAANFHSFTLVL